jgi:hypothetical protein
MRVLIVGLGSIGQRHVRNLRALLGDRLELLAVRVRGLNHVLTDAMKVESPDGLCEKYDIRTFGDLDQALVIRTVCISRPRWRSHAPVATCLSKSLWRTNMQALKN